MELTLFVDHACNLRCTYCYTGAKFGRRMSDEVMHSALHLALSSEPKWLHVSFFGGEPLLHPEFLASTVARVEALTRPGFPVRYLLNTNATLVNSDVGKLLPADRTTVFVSLDGSARLHDLYRKDVRGAPTYQRVAAGIAQLRELGMAVHLVGVVNPETAPHVGEMLAEMLLLEPERIVLTPNFRAEWTTASIDSLRAGLSEAVTVWADAFRAGRKVAVEPLMAKILSHLHGGMPCPIRCQLGGRELAVAPSGRIYPCAQMIEEDDGDALCIGDVAIGVDRDKVQRLQSAKDRVEETCAACGIRDRCQSHCGCRHIALTGRLGAISGALCETEHAWIDAADTLAESLVHEGCAAFDELFYQQRWVPTDEGRLVQLRRRA